MKSASAARVSAAHALKGALLAACPGADIDANARAASVEDVLLPTIPAAYRRRALEDVRRGDGRELEPEERRGLRPPFHSAHSSAALAVNSFACWLGRESELHVAGVGGFNKLCFERQLRIFRGGRAPNLDVVAEGDELLLGIESKCTEYLSGHSVSFSDAYQRPNAFGDFADRPWRAEYEALTAEGRERYARLDAAQLLKHYLGLRTSAQRSGKRAALVYLYWEPRDAGGNRAFDDHRRDLEHFRQRVDGGDCDFRVLSYETLWSEWEETEGLAWLDDHLAQLRARYGVALAEDY